MLLLMTSCHIDVTSCLFVYITFEKGQCRLSVVLINNLCHFGVVFLNFTSITIVGILTFISRMNTTSECFKQE